MSLIDSLVGTPTVRPDNKRILPVRRPFFLRPRDVFEIIVALAGQATMIGIFHSVALKPAEPRILTFLVLNRWPTEEELAALPEPYSPQEHIRALLLSREFRASLFRRVCDAYPERTRLFFVRLPRCAGEHFLSMATDMHPIFHASLFQHRPRDENRFIPELGKLMGRFTLTTTLMTANPAMAPFIQAPSQGTPNPALAEIGFEWSLNPPPRRANDRLFTIVREPTRLILSEINATIDRLLQPKETDSQQTAKWRAHLPSIAGADQEGRKQIGRTILRRLTLRNPICHALADGTAKEALRAAKLQDIEIADFSRYMDWVKYTWNVEPNPPQNTSTPHLTTADLSPADLALLRSHVAEDLVFYAAFEAAQAQIGDLRYSIRGRDL